MSLRPVICSALLTTLLGACSTAKFSGSTKATGSSEPVPEAPGGDPETTAISRTDPTGTADPGSPSDKAADHTTDAADAGAPGGSPGVEETPAVVTSTPATQTPDGPTCSPGQHGLGARLAFLIDNSGSNATTDCPNKTANGSSLGQTTYACGGQTNRELAVLSAYDILAKFAADHSSDTLGLSQLSISSFPTKADQYGGFARQTSSWTAVNEQNRGTIAELMKFARTPVGATPYGAAMTAATDAFKNVPNDGRRNVAILVSDGQPTDRNPAAVLAQANALKQQGVTVIVLDYNGSPASSVADDTKQMQAFEASYSVDPRTGKPNGNHWYTSNYASFADYISALLGTSSTPALAQSMTSSGSIISVQNAAALTAALNSLVSTSTVACTP